MENVDLNKTYKQNKLSHFSSGDKKTSNNISLFKKIDILDSIFNMVFHLLHISITLLHSNKNFIFPHPILLHALIIMKEHI